MVENQNDYQNNEFLNHEIFHEVSYAVNSNI